MRLTLHPHSPSLPWRFLNSLRVTPARNPRAVVASVDPIHDSKAEVNGVLYHYLLAKGHGDPVVLLNGGVRPRICGDLWCLQLVARGHTILAPDLRGLGDTTKPDTATTTRQWLGTSALSWQSSNSEHTVNILGQDWEMVAYADAAQELRTLATLRPAARYLALGRDNHARGVSGFFAVRDFAEMLIAGRSGSFCPGSTIRRSTSAPSGTRWKTSTPAPTASRSVAGGVRLLSSVPRRRKSQCRILETKTFHAGARHWRGC